MTIGSLSQFHENESLLAVSQSVTGKLVVWGVATSLLFWLEVSWAMISAFGLIMVFPQQRRLLLSLGATGMLAEKVIEVMGWHWLDQAPQIATILTTGVFSLYVAFFFIKHFERWPAFARRSPLLLLHAGIWFALSLSTLPALGAFAMVPFLTWRLSYMVNLAKRGKAAETRFRDHLFYLVPAYGGNQTPYAKGLEFLSRNEASDPASIARSQLSGVKLLVLAISWTLLLDLMDSVLFGQATKYFSVWPEAWKLGLPGLPEYLQTGQIPAWYQGWLTIYLELIRATVRVAAAGHVIIGCLRLSGFNVFRNTYKPLLAESIVEFWNRFYYYFKELLVDFFFYPAYLRLKMLSPRMRMLAAVFAAAFLGNMYHHVLARPESVLNLDPTAFWSIWGPRTVYCFLLATGIWVSMLRQQKIRVDGVKSGKFFRFRRIAGVWTFYGIILIWNKSPDGVGIGAGLKFFLSLFGL